MDGASTARISAAVELSALRKSFGVITAVDGVDLSIAGGEIVALLGPNGAGKSTLIDMLLGLIAPDHGTAVIFGKEPRQATSQGRVGAMLQDGGLPSYLTVKELISLMRSLYQCPASADQIVAQARIGD